jgi:SAM-dependent methyltransferase
MTRFEDRIDAEQKILAQWKTRYDLTSALDAACGTGMHAIILSRLGIKTAGADPSEGMLEQARRNAERAGVAVDWVKLPFADLSRGFGDSSFDAVFCLGNSLPHLLEHDELMLALENFNAVLRPGGILVVQILNYARILEKRQRIVGINESGAVTFVRFYDFLEDDTIRFNILRITREQGRLNHKLQETLLRAYRMSGLERPLEAAGLGSIETYGDLNFAAFEPDKSQNLVIVARAAR